MRVVTRNAAMRSAAVALLAAVGTRPVERASALPEECMNGVMEQRQAMGLDPFAPPCTNPDPDRDLPPAYPIFVAERTVEMLLSNEELFRNTVRMGLPTGALQLPPEISLSVFERFAELRVRRVVGAPPAVRDAAAIEADALREAGRTYVRAAYDANELVAFAYQGRKAQGRASDAQVSAYVDDALAACRKCEAALRTVLPLLPSEILARQGQQSSSLFELAVERRYLGDAADHGDQ